MQKAKGLIWTGAVNRYGMYSYCYIFECSYGRTVGKLCRWYL